MRKNPYQIDDTRFIFRTNFSGDPARDTGRYPNDIRKANVVIPSEEQAKDLIKEGIEVQTYQPKPRNEGDPIPDPIYFVRVMLQYWKKDGSPVEHPPVVRLFTDDGIVDLGEEAVNELDHIRIRNVNIVVRPYVWDKVSGRKSLKVQTLYVEQDTEDDPYAAMYRARIQRQPEDERPF